MPSPGREPGRSAGFSLIETLVALVITGLALTAIAGVIGNGLFGDRVSEAAQTALSLAEARIAAAGAEEALQPGHRGGVFTGRFHWQLAITRYDDRPPDTPAAVDPASTRQLYRIVAVVAWRDGLRQRRIELATLRLGPQPQ